MPTTDPIVPAIFEAAAEEAVSARGRAPLVARGGKARLLKTESGKLITHGEVIAGLLARADIESEVIDGKRPEWVRCNRCSVPTRTNKRGPIITLCKDCRRDTGTVCQCGGRKANKSKRCRGCVDDAKWDRARVAAVAYHAKPERTKEQISASAMKAWETRRAKENA